MPEYTETFDTELTIRSVQDVYTKLHERMSQDDGITLDLGKLTHIDTAGAQLLYLLHKHHESHSQRLTWQNGTAELQAQLQSLGIVIPALFEI